MTTEELAGELYNLIVLRGRWNDRPPQRSLGDDHTYDTLPNFVKEMWEDKANEFAKENRFKVSDV